MAIRKLWQSVAICVCIVVGTYTCRLANAQPAQDAKSHAAVVLNGAGATFPVPLYQKWFQEYQAKTGVQIDYEPIGSGGGIKQITAKSVDFGASDRGLGAINALVPPGLITIPTTIGLIAVIYNVPGIGTGLRMTPQVVSNIYLGKITRWNDPRIRVLNRNLKLPNMAIKPIHQGDGSATTSVFTKWLSLNGPEFKKKIGSGIHVVWVVGLPGKLGPGVAGLVKQIPGSIGYEEYAFVIPNVIPYASIQNRFGQFVLPSVEAGTAAAKTTTSTGFPRDIPGREPVDGYPLSHFTYLLIYPDAKPELKAFIRWALTDGVKDEASMNYSPLPPNVTQEALAAISPEKK